MPLDWQAYQDVKFQSPEKILQAQRDLLRRHLTYAQKNSQAYRKILKGVEVEAFELDQLTSLPFTAKKDIENDPKSFLAAAGEEIADIALSSGTTGKPIQIFYTENDLKRLAYNEEQSFEACGIQRSDIALLTCTMDRCFVAGLAYFLGMRKRGATVIRNGHGSLESHLEIIRSMKPSVIVGVPTFLKKMGLAFEREAKNNRSVKKIICIGEPLRDQNLNLLPIGRELEQIWNAKIYSTYASSETITTFCECTAQKGGHLIPELAIVEIVNEQGIVLPSGEIGEVVLTPMAVEGMPLLRYKTGDISFLDQTPCSCGRFSARLGPILGRKNQRMKVKGTSLYPQALFSVLESIPGVQDYYVEAFTESELSDILVVHVAIRGAEMTETKLEEILIAKLRVKLKVQVESEEAIKRKIFAPQSRKPTRFFDERKEYAESI